MDAEDAELLLGVNILLLSLLKRRIAVRSKKKRRFLVWKVFREREREKLMELSIHFLMSYDFLIENTSAGESKDSCLHVYQACYLKFACILCTYVNFNIDIASHFFNRFIRMTPERF